MPLDQENQAPKPVAEIGGQAPDFEARSTQGPFRLSELRGRWVVFFAHPADFTPVCTTEFGAVAQLADEWAKRGVRVNNICPGPTTTDRAIELAGARAAKKGITVEEELANMKQRLAGRAGKPVSSEKNPEGEAQA